MDWRFDGLTALVSIAAAKAADLVVLAGNEENRRRRESGDRLQRRRRLRRREAHAFGEGLMGLGATGEEQKPKSIEDWVIQGRPTKACSGRAISLSLMQDLSLPAVRARR